MAKSSINFQKAAGGGLKHNDRTEAVEPDYLLPLEHRLENEVDISALDAEQKIQDLYAVAKENYQENFGQKLQAKNYTWEAVINLNKEHTLEDVHRLVKVIEKETGFTAVQSAIHRDEGHVNERGVPIYNLHAHVTFFTLDQENGKQLMRQDITPKERKALREEIFKANPLLEDERNKKQFNEEYQRVRRERYNVFDKAKLSKLQTLTAETLGMERGKEGSTSQRRGAKEERAYRQEKAKDLEKIKELEAAVDDLTKENQNLKAEKSQDLAKVKDLKAEIAEAKAQLKAQGAGREDYAELEQLNRDLKARIKDKDLTIEELKEKVQTLSVFSNDILEKNNELEAKISDLSVLGEEIPEKNEKNDLKAISDVLDDANEVKPEDKTMLFNEIKRFEEINIINDFAELVREKGEHKEPGMINKRHTVTFEMDDLKHFLAKLEDTQKLKERLLARTKELLNKFEKPLNAIKGFVYDHFTKPKQKEQQKQRLKELHQKKLQRESKKKTDRGFGL